MLGKIEGFFLGAKTKAALEKMLQHVQLEEDGFYDMLDSTGEGWCLMADYMVLSPLTLKNGGPKKK